MSDSDDAATTEYARKSTGKTGKRSLLKILLSILIAFVVVSLVTVPLVAWWFLAGTIQGAEFCPDDFSQRHFTYRVSPLSGKQTKGMTYTTWPSGISGHLVAENYLQSATEPKTWHLLWDNQLHDISPETEARILDTYLNQTNDSWELYWIVWSDENPDHAKIFWPVISQMARDELYVRIPPVMESVRHPGEIKEFKSRLFELVASIYVERADDAKQLGENSMSDSLYERAAEFRLSKDSVDAVKAGKLDNSIGAEAEAADQPAE